MPLRKRDTLLVVLALAIAGVALQSVLLHWHTGPETHGNAVRARRAQLLRQRPRPVAATAIAPLPPVAAARRLHARAKQRLLCMFPVGQSAGGHGMHRGLEYGITLAKMLVGPGRCDDVHLYSVVPPAAQRGGSSDEPPPDALLGMSSETLEPHIMHVKLALSHESEVYENHFEKLYHMYAYAYVREMRGVAEDGGGRGSESWDWYVKIDTDSIFIPENFHRMLRDLNADGRDPLFLGHQLNHRRVPINVGCAYAVSAGALALVGPELLRLPFARRIGDENELQSRRVMACADHRTNGEEFGFAVCLLSVGVQMVRARDALGREYIMPYQLRDHYFMIRYNAKDWYWQGKDQTNQLCESIAEYPVCAHNYRWVGHSTAWIYGQIYGTLKTPNALNVRNLMKAVHSGLDIDAPIDSALSAAIHDRWAADTRDWPNDILKWEPFLALRSGCTRGDITDLVAVARSAAFQRTLPSVADDAVVVSREVMQPAERVRRARVVAEAAAAAAVAAAPSGSSGGGGQRRQRLLCMFPVGSTAGGHGMHRGHEYGLDLARFLVGPGRCDDVHLYSIIPVAAQDEELNPSDDQNDRRERPPKARLGMSSETLEPNIEHIFMTNHHETEVYTNHFEKLYGMYAYAYVRELEEWDWFVKIDTDAIFIPENFHRMLRDLNLDGNDPLFLGHQLNHRVVPINVGCAYAVSKGALRLVGPHLLRLPFSKRIVDAENPRPGDGPALTSTEREMRKVAGGAVCADHRTNGEEFGFAVCLIQSGAKMVRARDGAGREYIMPYQLRDHFYTIRYNAKDWYWQGKDKKNCLCESIAEYPVCAHNYRWKAHSTAWIYGHIYGTLKTPNELNVRNLMKAVHSGLDIDAPIDSELSAVIHDRWEADSRNFPGSVAGWEPYLALRSKCVRTAAEAAVTRTTGVKPDVAAAAAAAAAVRTTQSMADARRTASEISSSSSSSSSLSSSSVISPSSSTAPLPFVVEGGKGVISSSAGPVDAFGGSSNRFTNVCVTFNVKNSLEHSERALIYFTGDTSPAAIATYVKSRQCVPCTNPQMTTKWNELIDADYPHNSFPIPGKHCGAHWFHEVRAPNVDALSKCWANNAKEISDRGQTQAPLPPFSESHVVVHAEPTLLVQFYQGNIGHQIFDSVLAMGGALVAMLESAALEDAHFKLLIQQDPACTESKSFVCHVLTIFGLLDGKGGGGWGNQSPEQQNGERPFTLIPYAKDDGKLHCFRDLIAPKVGLGRVIGSKVDQPTLAKFVAKLREVLNAESSSQKPSPNLIVSGSKLKKKKKKVWVVYGRADAGRRRWTDSETVVAQLRAAFGANAVQMSSVVYVPSMGGLSYSEQMHVFADAHVLLAPHGAHMGNSLFFQSGAIVREVSCTGYSHFKKYPGLVKTLAINFRTVVIASSSCTDSGGEQGMLDADFEWGAKEVLASVRDAIDSSEVRELSQHSAFGGTGSGSGETSVLAGLASSFLSVVGAVAATTPTGSSAAHDGSGASSSATSVTTPSLNKCSQALQFPLCGAANNAHDRSALPTSLEGVDNVAACAFNFDKDPRYLPDPDVIACFDAYPDQLLTTWRADAKVLYANALALQSPTDCATPISADRSKWNLVRWYPHGHGYNLFMMVWNIGNHWDRGVPVMIGESRYRLGDSCGQGWSCFLRKISSTCEIKSATTSPTVAAETSTKAKAVPLASVLVYNFRSRDTAMSLDTVCQPHGAYIHGRCLCDVGFLPSESAAYPFCKPLTTFQRENEHFWLGAAKEYTANPKATLTTDVLWNTQAPGESNPQATSNPVHFPYNAHTEQAAASASSLSAADAQLVAERRTWKGKHGFVWWHAHVNWFLHKDSPRRASLDEYVASLKLRPSCIAVHIRRGDSCHDETKAYRKCYTVPQYVDAIRTISKKYYTTINHEKQEKQQLFIATDEPSVLVTLQQEYGAEFDLLSQISSLRASYKVTGRGQGIDGRTELNTPAYAEEIYRDLWALSHCGAFVGTFSSAIGWQAYGLMTARREMYRPFISLDLALTDPLYLGKFVKKNVLDGTL